VTRSNVRVRPVEPADITGLVALTRSFDLNSGLFSGRPLVDQNADHLAQRFAEIIAADSRAMLVAVDDHDGVVGLLVARPDDVGAIDLTQVLHISHLMVLASCRRRGIGRQLLGAAVHLADERGLDHVLATAGTGSREANRYLSRLGFAPLVTHRMASTTVLRRALGMSEAPERMAVLRRARLLRASRTGAAAVALRAARRGA
jgi:ribosomal protein S18 acetylase RimI-like enzyme